MAYSLIDTGNSRSFPAAQALAQGAAASGDVVVIIGADVARGLAGVKDREKKTSILLELGTECLGVHTGESRGTESSMTAAFTPRATAARVAKMPTRELMRMAPCSRKRWSRARAQMSTHRSSTSRERSESTDCRSFWLAPTR